LPKVCLRLSVDNVQALMDGWLFTVLAALGRSAAVG